MLLRIRNLLAAAVGVCAAQLSLAQEPAVLGQGGTPAIEAPNLNQQTADAVARRLRESGLLRNYHVDISCLAGTVELTGVVADQSQRDEVVRLAQGVPSVVRIIDRVAVASAVQQVQAAAIPPTQLAPAFGAPPPPPTPGSGLGGSTGGATLPDPIPLTQGSPSAGMYDLNPPKMPPYAWPTYAPYNNFSRVAYPEAYPYQSWPFIGPFYPFPKVPLGWRSVKLEFEDGYWWFSKVGCKYDWWRVKFW